MQSKEPRWDGGMVRHGKCANGDLAANGGEREAGGFTPGVSAEDVRSQRLEIGTQI